LWLLEVSSGKLRRLGDENTEFSPDADLHWSGDGGSLYALRTHEGRHQIVRVAVPSGELQPVAVGDRQHEDFALAGSRLLFTLHTPVQPSELWSTGLDGRGERPVTDLNAWWRERVP